jgi:competence protein ComFA
MRASFWSARRLAVKLPGQGGDDWTGQLQERQEGVSRFLLEKFAAKEDCLVEAVTGAGKTEMIFPLISRRLG